MGMKRMLLLILVIASVLFLSSCNNPSMHIPRVELVPTGYRYDTMYIPLRDGFIFSEDPFSIIDTESGYDIIIHAEKEIEGK